MAKMDDLFEKHPPLKPLNSLEAIVEDWNYRFGKNGISKAMRDEVVDWCAEASSLEQAIKRACESRRPNGKMHNHQTRVRKSARDLMADNICNQCPFDRIKNFDELHDWIEKNAPWGIGPVTVYDIATRIAAYLKLPVESLYLKAGTRIGWNSLHGHRAPDDVKRIPRAELPLPLQSITADEVEDLLCAYRNYLTEALTASIKPSGNAPWVA